MTYASAVRRGCGTRQKGGVYAETGIALPGEPGLPLEAFLNDPPVPIDLSAIGLTPVAVKLTQIGDSWHVFDFVGEIHYPNVADFLEEVRRYGVSRRLPRNLDYEKLTSASKLVVVHRKAWIENVEPYYRDYVKPAGVGWDQCPRDLPQHLERDEMCAGLYWQDLDPDEGEIQHTDVERQILRVMPSFSYFANEQPISEGQGYAPAIFASFPIHRLAVVNDPDNQEQLDKTLSNASLAQIPTDLVED